MSGYRTQCHTSKSSRARSGKLWFRVTLEGNTVGQTRPHKDSLTIKYVIRFSLLRPRCHYRTRRPPFLHTATNIAAHICRLILSIPTLALDDHERQDNIVQHMHPRRSYHESCLAFVEDVMCPMKFSDHGLLPVRSDQLDNSIGQNISAEASCETRRSIPWDNLFPSHPSPICTERHPVQ